MVATEDDDDVPLQCLGDLATSVPKTLQPHLNDLFTLCTSVMLSFIYFTVYIRLKPNKYPNII